MENPQSLAATDSFSYSWLTGRRTSCDDDVFKDPRFAENFNFDVPVTAFHVSGLVHADEIFCGGQIMPLYHVSRSSSHASVSTNPTIPSSPPSSSYMNLCTSDGADGRNEYCLLGKWRRSSKRILQRCFCLVQKPSCRKSSRVDDLDRKVCEIRSKSNSLENETSPRRSSVYSVVEWEEAGKTVGKRDDRWTSHGLKRVTSCRGGSPRLSPSYSTNSRSTSSHVESSIHEAILYCKRSIG